MQDQKPPVGLSIRLPVSLIGVSNTRSVGTRAQAGHPMQLTFSVNFKAKVRRMTVSLFYLASSV
jgi:hypothetical protein